MARIYVSLGSNVDRENRLRQAVALLRLHFGDIEMSPVYDSAAVGFDGSNFLNLVAAFDSPLEVEEVGRAFRDIENQLGRDRSLPKFASRSIDLDILLYDDHILDVPGIHIPRPEILVNAFVLKPLQDIAPQRLHPETGQTFAALWQAMAADAPRLELFPLEL
ncbi:MAG: 2-amino-4-hydroxy-6-hydroxymethyldihydropteridine diphosphokinase [Gammaproteobacteria bacterium]|jgi:2-amino-4-hydroxy-6-hydroxymethyldihydropteridine diphosphokinase|nr:2-amino-4-hydroxy-6-hydroxymethyldihydropteridine diphosphokinase [Gammaproteobacteria bacterium]HUV22173.1 2-amino-4-hydroxy-6-hydroxymethyldihydropteridine diphosphokinase [Gammaproteobacteria bacterium]